MLSLAWLLIVTLGHNMRMAELW